MQHKADTSRKENKMAPTEKLLREIITGQATLVTEVRILNTRLFGGEGQLGIVPVLFDKQEASEKEIQTIKDKISAEIEKLKEKDLKAVNADVSELKRNASLLLWKTGAISGFGGSAVGLAASYFLRKLGLYP
jgi:hypothetical protein